MNTLLASRSLMALSLGFHIIFASISMILPFLMISAHILSEKKNDRDYYKLSHFWLRGVAILFAIGAVSGTILSFELGLLWPTFMEHAGPIIGMPFSLEGAAFFVEAVAIGFFLYGKDKLSKHLHLFWGLMIGISGVLSGILVVSANAWMNSPTGFTYENGVFSNIDPIAALFNEAWLPQAIHMILAAGMATCFLMAGIHALLLLKKPSQTIHKKALTLILIPACILSLLIPISGDFSAKSVTKRQPIKLAAMEAHFHTESGAGLLIGGIPNEDTATVKGGIYIPKLLSFLATGDFNAEVKGLTDFPKEHWPPVKIVHIAFQIMVGIGTLLALFGIITLIGLKKSSSFLNHRRYLQCIVLLSPLGFIALEAGWIVTEVGRQPWIIYNIMTVNQAVTPVPHIDIFFYLFSVLYIVLSITALWLMKRQFQASLHNENDL